MNDFARWSQKVALDLFNEEWERMPSAPGVYVIRRSRPIQRAGGIDRAGILYVGRASPLRRRLWRFWNCDHTASGFLWTHIDIAKLVLSDRVRTPNDVEKKVHRLWLRYATPINAKRLVRAERALMFAYFNKFGEAPPLNLSINQRWLAKPLAEDQVRVR